MIHFIQGDLFVNKMHAAAFAHGCNCVGVMGAGIAKMFRLRWPGMYANYRAECWRKSFRPGDSLPYLEKEQWIFCLGTQYQVGPDARLAWVERAASEMLKQADYLGIRSIAMPAVGCGIGGLQWVDVKEIFRQAVFTDWSGHLYLYEPKIEGLSPAKTVLQ